MEASGTAGTGLKARNVGTFRPVSTVVPAPKVPAPVEANSVMLLPLMFAANRSPPASKARPSGAFRPPEPERVVAVVLKVPGPFQGVGLVTGGG